MPTLILNEKQRNALLHSVETSIDILQDTALEPLWFNAAQVRELAGKSDADIRTEIAALHKQADENLENLEIFQQVYSELKEE